MILLWAFREGHLGRLVVRIARQDITTMKANPTQMRCSPHPMVEDPLNFLNFSKSGEKLEALRVLNLVDRFIDRAFRVC